MKYYSEFSINDYVLINSENEVNDKVMSFFNEEHRKHETMQKGANKFIKLAYQMPVKSFSRRLSINGYTIERAREDYNGIRARRLKSNLFSEHEKELIRKLDINIFEMVFYNIIKYKIYRHDLDVLTLEDIGAPEEYHEYIRFILDDYYDNGLESFVEDIRSLLQITCYIVEQEGIVDYDITDLLESEFYTEKTQFANNSKKIIVKTI